MFRLTREEPVHDAYNCSIDEIDFKIALYRDLGVCIECHVDAIEQGFRTKDCENEFSHSALCQACQDKAFGKR